MDIRIKNILRMGGCNVINYCRGAHGFSCGFFNQFFETKELKNV